ncbi:hypothetical protein EPA93_46845 [Ktedonosporobacter rubrisoli]|uniref:Beta-galactosidase trimerisation domain-containing protein n=1 Tax=Ktedonosporobacter rubrisoli TaxID=2509675 RepID=A0A4P6K685_KTERU|nr:beta-galactosidase trimerization domain-containing protein [Ktedonosporobacter rubrisoli]QBD83086.1 hypothetical protein EPA93_46845 [Ktedonosporobacter rubrisoli]
MEFPTFPMRQVHLDFHTSPDIPDVGADWDADHFIETLTRARVNSITVFAKCHHGMNYYPTRIGTVHPSLKFDLLGAQIEACHRAGIRCPIYLSVCWDVAAAERHPEWRQIDKDGRQMGGGPFDAYFTNWPYLCVNTAYADELIAQTEELLANYDCDGFFYDILLYNDEGCLCTNCLRDMRDKGLDPQNSEHRQRHNNEVARTFMRRISNVIREKVPHAGIFFNSRWGLLFADEAQYYSQVEIESLPTGGWGYDFYPLWSRYGRDFGLPMLGMTGRFHESWADWGGLKHPDALRFECAGILATGGAISVGDQLHPRAQLNEAVYDVIGEAFGEVEAVERYCIDARPVSQVALLILEENAAKAKLNSGRGILEGASLMLLELHQQFDVITERCPDFSKYDVIVVPDEGHALPGVVERLKAFVAGGGKLLLSHEALLNSEHGNFWLADEMGVDYQSTCESVPDYFKVSDPALQSPATRPNFAYSLYEGPCVRVKPRAGTRVLAEAYETYFNRTWQHYSSHRFTPPKPTKADYPAVTISDNVAYIYGPIFGAYMLHGNLTYRALVGRCLELLQPEPLVRTTAPATTEVTVMQQSERQIVHLVNYHAQRRPPALVESLEVPVPLHEVKVDLRRATPTTRVFLAHSGEQLPFEVRAGVVSVTVPRVDVHAMLVFDGDTN